VAGGVAAGFDAPLTAILFALEIVQPQLPAKSDDGEYTTGPPRSTAGAVLAASAMATIISRTILPEIEKFQVSSSGQACVSVLHIPFHERWHRSAQVKAFQVIDPFSELPAYIALGVLAAGVATTFVGLQGFFGKFYAGKVENFEFMEKARTPRSAAPAQGTARLSRARACEADPRRRRTAARRSPSTFARGSVLASQASLPRTTPRCSQARSAEQQASSAPARLARRIGALRAERCGGG
jgi:hypothetical protein